MKLQNKLVFYNSVSKIVIIVSIGIILPMLIEKIGYDHTDKRLVDKRDKVLNIINVGGIAEITKDEDCSYGNYNILKEEYIAIFPLSSPPHNTHEVKMEDAKRDIEGEIFYHRVLSQPFFYDNQYYLLEIGRDLSTIEEFNHTIKRFTLVMLLVVISLFILIDLGFTRIVLLPFNRIIHKLKNVKHPTGFDTTPVRSSTDDFRLLDQSLNEMMVKIKDAFLVEKEFIANVSHELLTPISILQGKLENILVHNESLSEELAIKIVDSLKILNRLTKIIKALLLISKIENDQYLKTDTVNVRQVIDEVVTDIEERLTEKEIGLSLDIKENFLIPNCNKTLLHHLFFNIINNAIKYNKPHGKIIIRSYSAGQSHIVEVSDTGVGIEAENLNFIFGRFKKLGNEEKDSYGLGLPIVKTIAGFHGITVDVQSQPGEGTTFRLNFKKS